MKHTLENRHYQFTLDLTNACWSLYPKSDNTLLLENVRMEMTYRCQGKRFSAMSYWAASPPSKTEAQPSPQIILR